MVLVVQLSTNGLADDVEKYFERDYTFETQYHTLLNGESRLNIV